MRSSPLEVLTSSSSSLTRTPRSAARKTSSNISVPVASACQMKVWMSIERVALRASATRVANASCASPRETTPVRPGCCATSGPTTCAIEPSVAGARACSAGRSGNSGSPAQPAQSASNTAPLQAIAARASPPPCGRGGRRSRARVSRLTGAHCSQATQRGPWDLGPSRRSAPGIAHRVGVVSATQTLLTTWRARPTIRIDAFLRQCSAPASVWRVRKGRFAIHRYRRSGLLS